MAELSINRRKFFKKSIKLGVGGFFAASIGSHFISKKSEVNPAVIVDTTIDDMAFKLHGMSHSREFVEKYHDSLDDLVKNARAVVSEGTLKSKDMTNSAKPYFETIWELCKKYDKPLINLDPTSFFAGFGEMFSGMFGMLLMIDNADRIVDENSTRRRVIKHSLKTAAGLYLFMSNFLYGMGLKKLIDKNHPRREKYYYNHIIDQRNVEIANRLLKLPDMLRQEELSEGDYVLVDYGRWHIPGIMQYLKSPVMRRVKTAMYALTYSLIDADEITFCRHNGRFWKRKALK